MPAPTTSLSPSLTANKSSSSKPNGQVKKKRVVRRRGRAPGDVGSDDDIEREAATDSESEDELSSLDSASDSDTEAASEDVIPNGRSRAFTPNTSQSPGERGGRDNEANTTETFFTSSGNWSEMVADEKANGPADLPVIEFADFDGHNVPTPSRSKRAKKAAKFARSAPTAPPISSQTNGEQALNDTGDTPHVASTSGSPTLPFQRRPPGQTARQAYQQRLESDPSYVPTVGGFWGHDDRLLDKDLRSLSGWWRGRWQGRGRGNGFFRGRGRGGFFGGHPDGPVEDGNSNDIPPVERAWGHDGFEEMKQKEERRRESQHAETQTSTFQSTSAFRGRGYGAVRGGRGGFGRGGFTNTSGRSSVNSGRIWFSMKPELTWTKQHEGFLYFELDPSLKPRQGQGQGIVIRLPGQQAKIARTQPRSYAISQAPELTKTNYAGSDHEDRVYTVKLPRRYGKGKEVAITANSVGGVPKDRLANPVSPKETVSKAVAAALASPTPRVRETQHRPELPIATTSNSQPGVSVRSQLAQLSVEPERSDPVRSTKTEEAVMKNPVVETQVEDGSVDIAPPAAEESSSQPSLPPVFSPPISNPSPVYGSPYGFQPPLPPGFGINQHGVAFELATGRPFYYQPPPPPMYNPRPVMHSHLPPPGLPFVPSHMPQHSAVSPDFLAHSASHTPPMNGFIDPSTGTPIFSFPRQTSRIEIRAPSEGSEVKSPGKTSSSGLRTAAASFEPARSASDMSANGYYPSISTPENGALPSYAPADGAEGSVDDTNGLQHDANMVTYAQYPQQYYYPDAYGYTHNPYMDMSHPRSYEMYPSHDGTVYY